MRSHESPQILNPAKSTTSHEASTLRQHALHSCLIRPERMFAGEIEVNGASSFFGQLEDVMT